MSIEKCTRNQEEFEENQSSGGIGRILFQCASLRNDRIGESVCGKVIVYGHRPVTLATGPFNRYGFRTIVRKDFTVMAELSFKKKLFLFASPGIAIAFAFAMPSIVSKIVKSKEPHVGLLNQTSERDGQALFLKQCAYCHGPEGHGDGPAELSIKARAFGWDKFKFATTMNGVPTDDNLLAVLKRGIPGSAMPSFDALPEEDLKLLIGHVREMNFSGLYGRIEKKQGDEPDTVALHQQIVKLTTPGDPLPIPEFTPATSESLANGKKIYLTSCASCHGPLGKGDGPQEMKDDDGKPTRPRDLTRGVYKGGGTKADLYARLMLGVPGSPMPASTTLKLNEVQDVLNYILSLVVKGESGT